MSDARSSPPVAPAVIVGGAKGALAGSFIAAIAVLALWRELPGDFLARLAGGLVLASATLCALDAASARVESIAGARALRFLAGSLAPVAALSPHAPLVATKALPLGSEELLVGAVVAVGLGAGLVAAGEPDTPPHRAQGCLRLLIPAGTLVLAWAVADLALSSDAHTVMILVLGALMGFAAAGAFWIAQGLASFAVPPLAQWLEPDRDIDAPDHPRAEALRDLELVERCLGVASDAEPVRRGMALNEALEACGRLAALAEVPGRGVTPGAVALKRAEVLLALGELDQAERVAPDARDRMAVEAEVARRRGDAEKAASIAQRWLDASAGDASYAGQTAQASAFALLALARADQGRFDEAERACERLRAIPAWHARAFRHLTAGEVAVYIAACRDRARPPS